MDLKSMLPLAETDQGSNVRVGPEHRRGMAFLVVAALTVLAAPEPALAQQYLGVTKADQAPKVVEVSGFSGKTEMWWTREQGSFLVTGTAGVAPGMERLHSEDARLKDVVTRCYGWGGAHGTASGQCINRDADGDIWFEVFFCDQEVPPPDRALYACEGTLHAIGGSGKFRNISGSGTFMEYVLQVTPDGMLVGYSPGSIDLTW